MKKAIILTVLLLLPILLLTACGGGKKSAATSAITTTVTSAPVTTSPVTTPAVTSTPEATAPVTSAMTTAPKVSESITTPTSAPITTPGATTPKVTSATTPGATTPKVTTPVTSTPETSAPSVTVKDVTIAGVPLKDYTIVYAKSEYAIKRNSLEGTEYDFYKLTAEKIAEDLKAICGVTLPVVSYKTEAVKYEILVGPTDRKESECLNGLDLYAYVNRVVNGKLVVGGGKEVAPYTKDLRTYYAYAATYHAFDAMVEELKSGKNSFAEGFDLSGTKHFTTIACVGDSITEGVGSRDIQVTSYPAILQRLLWKDCIVLNYGNSGKTMRNDVGANYTGTLQHQGLMGAAHLADLTLVMLGTNDSYFDRSWSEADNQSFNAAATSLFTSLREKNPEMKLVLMNCPAYYGNSGWASVRVRNLQAGLPELLAGKGVKDVMFFNMHEFTDKNLGPSHYPDSLHPNDRGYAIMARELERIIPDFLSGKWNAEPYFFEELTGEAPDVPIAQGAVNLMEWDLDELYAFDSGRYGDWDFTGAPYFYTDLQLFQGCTIKNIEFPVRMAKAGQTLTVRVAKYEQSKIVDVISTHTLTADFQCGTSWAKFAVNIEVPKGYTLFFGLPEDTLDVMYLETQVPGYTFYGAAGNIGYSTLAFNVYGIRNEIIDEGDEDEEVVYPGKNVAKGSKNLLGIELDSTYNIATYKDWLYSATPFYYVNAKAFSGKTITDIQIPVGSAKAGSTMKISVVKLDSNRVIAETLKTITLTAEKAYSNEWVMFSSLDLVVPEGYTLAFGSASDTILLKYIPQTVPGYDFHPNDGSYSYLAALAFNVYGFTTEGGAEGGEEDDTDDEILYPGKNIAEGSKNLLGIELDTQYNIATYNDWLYSATPFYFVNTKAFSGKTITDIQIPVGSAQAGSTMKISVVKLNSNRIIEETLTTITLTAEKAYTNEWVMFSGLDLEVPEGYTLAFGSASDTILLKYIPQTVPGYDFHPNDGSYSYMAALAFNVYGQ